MVFSNPAYDVDHNTSMPAVGSQYESVRKVWNMLGRYHQNPVQEVLYAPIGPRLVVTVNHIAVWPGQLIDIQGRTYTIVSYQASPNCDAFYGVVDQDIPQWFRRIQDADIRNITPANLLLHIGGGAGGYVAPDSEGWLTCYVDPDYAKANRVRWSIQRLDIFGPYTPFPPNPLQPEPPPYFSAGALFKHHDAPDGHPETGSPKEGDSGSPVFVNCGPEDDPWVFIGCVSGGGAPVVSPYKGQLQNGTSASMSYLDDATIRQLNGEPPPPPSLLIGIIIEPPSVAGGNQCVGRVDITGAAPAGGAVVTLTSEFPKIASVPPSVTVPQGQIYATFPVTTFPTDTTTSVSIHALLSLSGYSFSIDVTPYIPPVIPPPVLDQPKLVRKPVVAPTPSPSSNFEAFVLNGIQFTETNMWGEAFILDGNSKQFIGNFNQFQGSQQIGPGGYEEHVDGILVASKPQFGTTRLSNGQRLTIGGRRYVAVEIHEDLASWDFILKGINE